MVTIFPLVEEVMPVGNPKILTLVAPFPIVYWMGVIGLPEQIVWLSVPALDVKLKVAIGLTFTVIVVCVAHCPTFGVNV